MRGRLISSGKEISGVCCAACCTLAAEKGDGSCFDGGKTCNRRTLGEALKNKQPPSRCVFNWSEQCQHHKWWRPSNFTGKPPEGSSGTVLRLWI